MSAPLLGTRSHSQNSPSLSTRSPDLSRHKRRRSDHDRRSLLRRLRYSVEDALSGGSSHGRTRTRRALLAIVILGLLAYLLVGGPADEGEAAASGVLGPSPTGATALLHRPKLRRPFGRRKAAAATRQVVSTEHTLHKNGYLLVNPLGPHPIPGLIARAQKRWDALIARQSSTLRQAVAEYERRYRRHAPRGFDKWWEYARENEIILTDEYDQISRDFEPFWALESGDLRHRDRVMQERGHSFVVAFKDGKVSAHGEEQHRTLKRAKEIVDLTSRFAHLVPYPVNLTFIVDDQPAVCVKAFVVSTDRRGMMPWAQRDRYVELASLGERAPLSEPVTGAQDGLTNYANACRPLSPLRRSEQGEQVRDFSPASGQRSFIWDHAASMDLCEHPEYRELHGMTSKTGVGLGPIVPLFTWAKTSMHSDILVTPLEQYWDSYDGYDPDFADKSNRRLLWRGTTTGADFTKDSPWQKSQRARLHFLGHAESGEHEVMSTGADGEQRYRNETVTSLNRRLLDVSFSGSPAQCDAETCDWLAKNVRFAPTQGLEESYTYAYMMDVDGNGWSGRFHRLMSTRSLVLKSTVFPEWYMDRIQPWLHYVPIKPDYSDLYDVLAYFEGAADGSGSHRAQAEQLAEAGRLWALDHWRREDMAAYMFRVVLEYGRLVHQDLDVEIDYDDSEAY